jgi:superfamily II RNA helicase
MRERGFGNPEAAFWPAVAVYLWAKGSPWERVLRMVPMDEGDLASLVMRTADHLRQVGGLRETHPALAETAEAAVGRVLREPVYVD